MKLTQIFDELLQNAKIRWQLLREGTPLFIPFPDSLARLKEILPGLIKAESWIITAQTGIGKSKFSRFLFINWPIKYAKINKKIEVKILYNTLEETREEIVTGFIIEYVAEDIGESITHYQANGYGDVSSKIEKSIARARKRFEDLEQYIEITSIANPTGLYKKAREYALWAGKFYKDGKILTDDEVIKGWESNVAVYDEYKDDSNKYVIVIHDRLLLFNEERRNGKLMTQYETIMHWMDYYTRQILNKKFKFIVINVQQQIPSGDQKQYTIKGESIDEKLEPTLDKLNKVKATQQAATIIIGLFNPIAYGIKKRYEWKAPGYDLVELGDCYRELSILKHRKGLSRRTMPLYFDGAAEIFEDMPDPSDKKNMNKIFNRLEKRNNQDQLLNKQMIIDFDFISKLNKKVD